MFVSRTVRMAVFTLTLCMGLYVTGTRREKSEITADLTTETKRPNDARNFTAFYPTSPGNCVEKDIYSERLKIFRDRQLALEKKLNRLRAKLAPLEKTYLKYKPELPKEINDETAKAYVEALRAVPSGLLSKIIKLKMEIMDAAFTYRKLTSIGRAHGEDLLYRQRCSRILWTN